MKKSYRLLTVLLLFSAVAFAQSSGQPELSITGEVLKPLSLTPDDLSKMPQSKLKAKDRDNAEHEYSG
ncbi:MAG TPA: hypothetical protein VK658_25140, partial [Chryseolinea sp.]|nr:hypothetical protein [Chryseolinea sp.]